MQVPEGNVFGNPEGKTFKEMAGKAGDFNSYFCLVSSPSFHVKCLAL